MGGFCRCVGLLLLLLSLAPSSSMAAECGGVAPCHCGDTLKSSRTLDGNDVLSNCNGTILNFGANNLLLNCSTVLTTSCNAVGLNKGIVVQNFSGVTIKNCQISNCNVGMEFTDSFAPTLSKVTFKGQANGGIRAVDIHLVRSDFALVTSMTSIYQWVNNHAEVADVGLWVDNSDSMELGESIFDNWSYSIQVSQSSDAEIDDNTIYVYNDVAGYDAAVYFDGDCPNAHLQIPVLGNINKFYVESPDYGVYLHADSSNVTRAFAGVSWMDINGNFLNAAQMQAAIHDQSDDPALGLVQ